MPGCCPRVPLTPSTGNTGMTERIKKRWEIFYQRQAASAQNNQNNKQKD